MIQQWLTPQANNAGATRNQAPPPLALLASLTVGITFIPRLLLEEKENKPLRGLLVAPVLFAGILVSKLLVVLSFQLATASVVLLILAGFASTVSHRVLFVVLGACLSLSSGLLFGSGFNPVRSAGTVPGLLAFVDIISGIFAGQSG